MAPKFIVLCAVNAALFAVGSCAVPTEPPSIKDFSASGPLLTESTCSEAETVQGGWCWWEWSQLWQALNEGYNRGAPGCAEMQDRLLAMLYDGSLFKWDDQDPDAQVEWLIGQSWNNGQRLAWIGMNSRLLYEEFWLENSRSVLGHEFGHAHANDYSQTVANGYRNKCRGADWEGLPEPGPAQ
jgi:hypothetical protein